MHPWSRVHSDKTGWWSGREKIRETQNIIIFLVLKHKPTKPAAYHLLRVFLSLPKESCQISITQQKHFLCCSEPLLSPKNPPEFTFGKLDVHPHLTGAALTCVYNQVRRLSLSMCGPDSTVSMSIRRSEFSPSGMQGISSSPSVIGSTDMDSCMLTDGGSLESPEQSDSQNNL